jgi:hypothetical protein
MVSTRLNFVLGGAIILIALALQLKPEDSCETSSSKLLILVDQTDVISEKTLQAIKSHAQVAINNSKPYTNVVVKYISDGNVNKRYEGCRPSKVDWYTQIASDDVAMTKKWKQFVESFLTHLTLKVDVSETSPIYETIIDDSRTEFVDFKYKAMIVFSDFKQFTKNKINLQSVCKNPEVETSKILDTLATLPITHSETTRPLNGVSVKRYFIPRAGTTKANIECLVEVSDMVFQNLSTNSTELAPVEFLPLSIN